MRSFDIKLDGYRVSTASAVQDGRLEAQLPTILNSGHLTDACGDGAFFAAMRPENRMRATE